MGDLTVGAHAVRRALEFGIDLGVLERIAERPDVDRPAGPGPRGQARRILVRHTDPAWAVVVEPHAWRPGCLFAVTVVRRQVDHWHHLEDQ